MSFTSSLNLSLRAAATPSTNLPAGRSLVARRPVLRLAAFGGLAALVFVAGGCDASGSELQGKLHGKKVARFAEAATKVTEVEQARIKLSAETLPKADAEAKGGQHPLIAWRTAVAAPKADAEGKVRDDVGAIEKLMKEYRGTPAAEAARLGTAFVESSQKYWAEGKGLERYVKFLRGYKLSAEEAEKKTASLKDTDPDAEFFVQRPFLAEAAFERWFLHAARLAKSGASRSSITSVFKYWQVAFDYPAKSRESFSDYVTRLCLASEIRDRCNKVVHEMRPAAITKPYLEWVKAQVEAFQKEHKAAGFNDLGTRVIAQVDAQLAEVPDFTEKLVLPSTFSSRAASSALPLQMSADGVMLHTAKIAESFKGRVPSDLGAKAAEVIQQLKDTPGNTIDFERVVLEMPGDVAGTVLPQVIRAFPTDTVRQFDLIGRRRVDQSLRKTGMLLRMPGPDEGTNLNYQLKGQSSKTQCAYVGNAARPPIGRKEPGSYLVIDKKKIRAAKLTRDEETRELIASDLTLDIAANDWAGLAKWADANEGIIRFYVSDDFSYDEQMRYLTAVVYKCSDKVISLDELGKNTINVTCGNTEARDVTVPVGICQ